MSDDARKTILARRARFLAAAMAGVGAAATAALQACSDGGAQVCLSPLDVEDAAEAAVCLSVGDAATEAAVCLAADTFPLDTDATDAADATDATDVADDAGAADAADADDGAPQPCLKVAPDSGGDA